jgi:hypothetical protein
MAVLNTKYFQINVAHHGTTSHVGLNEMFLFILLNTQQIKKQSQTEVREFNKIKCYVHFFFDNMVSL